MKNENINSYRLYAVRDHSQHYVGGIILSAIMFLVLISRSQGGIENGFERVVMMAIPYGAVMLLYLFMLSPYSNWMAPKKQLLYRCVPNGYQRWKQSMQVNLYIASSMYCLIFIINWIVLDSLHWDVKGICFIYAINFMLVCVALYFIFQKQDTKTTTLLSLLMYPFPVFSFAIVMEMTDIIASISWLWIGGISLALIICGYVMFLHLCKRIEGVWYS